jgi:ATP-dependent helicase/nuclease subunit A
MTERGENRLPLVDQEARLEAVKNLEQNLWVEAGAGTGKTTLLIDRLLAIILSGKARLEQIVAITFTEKASAELKARLRDKLEEINADGPAGSLERVERALDEIDSAPISTIHSFAASLLRERPVEAGLDPRFTVADSEELEELLDRVWEQWISAELQNRSEPLRRSLKLGCRIEQLACLGKLLYQNRDLAAEGELEGSSEPAVDSFIEALRTEQQKLRELMADCSDQNDKGFQHLSVLIGEIGKLLAMEDQEEQERYLLLSLKKITGKGNQANWKPKESCRLQKEICTELNTLLADVRRKIAARLVADLTDWCKTGYLAAIEQAKRELGTLDFQDLLLKARDLLRHNLRVRGYFQERFRYLLVDEFQDTDPLQVELVFFLAEKTPEAENWQDAKIKKGKLFLVGDPKQSIYRFRRADIEIYQAAGARVLRDGAALQITQNFRTVPKLIDWVNRSFSRIIRKEGNFQPAYQNLSAFRDDPGHPALVIPDPGDTVEGLSADQVRAAEAEAVAAIIEDAAGSWPIDTGSSRQRTLAYGDIALLFPTTTGLEHYEEALRRRGIPFLLEGGKKFYLRSEIVALKNLLIAVSDPYDRLAITAVLRFWAGITDEELFLYRAKGGSFNYLSQAGTGFPKIEAAFAMLKKAYHRQHKFSPSAQVENLMAETWFWQRAILEPRSAQALANLEKIIQLLRAREQERPLTLKNFAYWLDQAWTGERDEEESMIHDAGSNTVQILTVHRSKGLEFPAVFLLNSGGSRNKSIPFIADRSRDTYYLNLGGELESLNYREALESEKLRLNAEQLRLFYVAATRARDYFVLPRYYRSGESGLWAGLAEDWSRNRDQWPGCRIIDLSDADLSLKDQSRDEKRSVVKPEELSGRREAHLEGLKTALAQASARSPYYSTGELTSLREESGEEQALHTAEQPFMSPGEGVSLGSAFHQVMEQVDLLSATPDAIEKHVVEAALYWALKDTGKLMEITKNALQHSLLSRARGATAFYREVPFVYNLGGKIIEGIVDLIYVEDGALVIVDYKTDDIDERFLEKRWQRYRRQGEIYALAMTEITGMKVKEISFYFVRPGTVKTILEPDPVQLKKDILAIIEEKHD